MAVANIITDASVRGDKWGWAGAIITDRGRVYISGKGKATALNSNDAELFAIANTLTYAFKHDLIAPNEIILIQVDNQHVIRLLSYIGHRRRSGSPTTTKSQSRGLYLINALCAKNKFVVRHIKAHLAAHARQPRHHVHEKLDQLAGEAARR